MIPSKEPHFQTSICNSGRNSPAPIADTISWIKIAKDHDRTANLESEFGERQSKDFDGIKVLHRIYNNSITGVGNLVSTIVDMDLSKKVGKNLVINVIHIIIVAGDCSTVLEALVIRMRRLAMPG